MFRSSHSDSELASKTKRTAKFKAKTKLIKTDFHKVLLGKQSSFRSRRASREVAPEQQQQRLLSAVSLNNVERVQGLLKMGIDPNSSDKIHRSALHLATSRGYTDIVKVLLESGADPNRKDIIQNTPLHLAACNSNMQIITLLIDGGADLRSLDMHGRNPLQLAESKLHILKKSWKTGAVEIMQIRTQVQEIVDIMISLWKHKESTKWGHHRDNVDDLELMKLSLRTGPEEQVDDQMNKLLSELQQFTIT